jgi:stress response protein SCP2
MSIGERVKLADFVDQSILNKKMFIEVLGEEELDITCFGLDSEEKLSDDRYMIFYNQLVSPNSEILANLTNSKKSIFEIDLNRLPANIKKLVFTLTLDSNKEIRNIKPIKLNIGNGIETSIQFVVKGEDFRNEKAETVEAGEDSITVDGKTIKICYTIKYRQKVNYSWA